MAEGSFVEAAGVVDELDIVEGAVAPGLEEAVGDVVVGGDHHS